MRSPIYINHKKKIKKKTNHISNSIYIIREKKEFE